VVASGAVSHRSCVTGMESSSTCWSVPPKGRDAQGRIRLVPIRGGSCFTNGLNIDEKAFLGSYPNIQGKDLTISSDSSSNGQARLDRDRVDGEREVE
jgi:hypothetical protein